MTTIDSSHYQIRSNSSHLSGCKFEMKYTNIRVTNPNRTRWTYLDGLPQKIQCENSNNNQMIYDHIVWNNSTSKNEAVNYVWQDLLSSGRKVQYTWLIVIGLHLWHSQTSSLDIVEKQNDRVGWPSSLCHWTDPFHFDSSLSALDHRSSNEWQSWKKVEHGRVVRCFFLEFYFYFEFVIVAWVSPVFFSIRTIQLNKISIIRPLSVWKEGNFLLKMALTVQGQARFDSIPFVSTRSWFETIDCIQKLPWLATKFYPPLEPTQARR